MCVGYVEPITTVLQEERLLMKLLNALGTVFRFINKKVKLLEVGEGLIIIDEWCIPL